MELRDRGIASIKTRYSADGPGLWTRRVPDNAAAPEARNRSETNSQSPEGRTKRKREVDNMRPRRNRTAASKMSTTNSASSNNEAQVRTNQDQDNAEIRPESMSEERSNGREPSHGDISSDDGNDRRYSFSNHRNEPTFLDRIKVLPEMRDLPWREGQTLPPEKSTESQRVQQRGACMVATRGRIMAKPCTHCEQGYGRFSHCIVLDEWFQGACATCIFTSKGNKCSLRIQYLGNQDARALRYSNTSDNSSKRKRSDLEKPSTEDDNNIFNRFNSPGHYVSPYPPLPSIPRPPLRTPGLKEAQEAELDSLLQAQIAREEFDQGNIDEGEVVANKQQARATPIVMHRPRFYTGEPHSMRQLIQQGGPPPPNRQLAQPINNIPIDQITRNPASAIGPHMMERSLIGESSRSTQRQLFTVISGVQGGLQQLQKELNSLKAVLGWDIEDEEPEASRRQSSSSRRNTRSGP
ncbi:e8e68739-87ce-4a9f-adb7-2e91cf163cd9 [Sclerotinia trifoliorum]|uniref:E8e68739-87ce-4a9f-adb7-2e91cf163cd9 n=1 Tax=Sclerotinia trifoliorum TaxID=28548 RepID=A0A8H2ZX67_9HELO|nr:e8e68739-87ce-4a9f-adb7-2e91cf163cd9 [Sclerotinia trifoliorum]